MEKEGTPNPEKLEPRLAHTLKNQKYLEILNGIAFPYSKNYKEPLLKWGADTSSLNKNMINELDALLEIGSYPLNYFSWNSTMADYASEARILFFENILTIPKNTLDSLKKRRKHYLMPLTVLNSIKEMEQYGFDSHRLVAGDVGVLDCIPKIPEILEVFYSYGFNKQTTRSIIERNPTIIRCSPERARTTIAYFKKSKTPYKSAITNRPRLLNLSTSKLASNIAYFDGLTGETNKIIKRRPSVLTISDNGKTQIEKLLAFCEEQEISQDTALKYLGRTSFNGVIERFNLLNSKGYDGGRILRSNFAITGSSTDVISRNISYVEKYSRAYGYNREETTELIEYCSNLLRDSKERLQYIARAVFYIISNNPGDEQIQIDRLKKIVTQTAISSPETFIKATGKKYDSIVGFNNRLYAAQNKKSRPSRSKNIGQRDYRKFIAEVKALGKAQALAKEKPAGLY